MDVPHAGGDRSQSVVDINEVRRVAAASAIGATIEWYDFFLYGVVTPIVFNKLFFPASDPTVGILLAYATFAVGFVARAFGGVVFGHFGDKVGRKTVLVVTLLLMGLSTTVIGLLPTYEQIGIWAPCLLLFLRILQGLGLGGEWGGAVLMAVEHAPERHRAFYGSWPQMGVPAGLCLATGVISLLSLMPEAAFLSYGWRIAFLLSAVMVAVGLYIRLTVLETPEFLEMKESGDESAVPVMEVITRFPKEVFLGMGARYVEGVAFNVFAIFVISYAVTYLQLPRSVALNAVIISSLLMLITMPVYGMLSDKYGINLIYGLGCALVALFSIPSFLLMSHSAATGESVWFTLALVGPLAIAFPAVFGTQAALFASLFPPRVRYSGVSFVYQCSGVFASGPTPVIATSLLSYSTGSYWPIVAYLFFVSVVSIFSVYKISKLNSNKRRPAIGVEAGPVKNRGIAA